jgi:hypothetical protein
MKMSLSYQEILALYECLVKSKKGGTNNFLLSDGEDWKKNPVRLVLKDSKYGGLVLVHMNCEKSLDIVEGDVPEGDKDDSMSVATPTTTSHLSTVDWVEAWAKFYISKNEDWLHVARMLNNFIQEVQHEMAVDDESAIPPTPPVTPVTSIASTVNQTTTTSSPFSVVEVKKLTAAGTLKTKGKSAAETKKPKRKRVAIDSDDEVCTTFFQEECKKTVLLLLKCMVNHGEALTFDQAVLKCSSELKAITFDYRILDGFKSMIESTSQKILQLCTISGISTDVICEPVLFF